MDFLKARTIFLGGELAGSGERLNFLQVKSGGAVACLVDLTELNTIGDQYFRDSIAPGAMKKRRFIEIDS